MKNNYSGIKKNEKTGKYDLSTSFKTRDDQVKRVCKRGFETMDDALIYKLQAKKEISNMILGRKVKVDESKTTEGLIDRYIKHKSNTCKPSTLYALRSILESMLKDFDLQDIDVEMVENIYTELISQDIGNNSKNLYISKLRDFLEYLSIIDVIDSSTFNKTKLITSSLNREQSKNNYITIDQLKSILELMPTELEKVCLKMFFFCGFRKGELYALNYSDIDSDGYITINKQYQQDYFHESKDNFVIKNYTKTNVTKCVTMPSWLYEELLSLKTDTDLIIRSTSFIGKFERHFKSATEMLNIDVRIHDLRHSCVCYFLDNGYDVKYVADKLGHKTEATTLGVYRHLTESKRKENDNKLNMIERI